MQYTASYILLQFALSEESVISCKCISVVKSHYLAMNRSGCGSKRLCPILSYFPGGTEEELDILLSG